MTLPTDWKDKTLRELIVAQIGSDPWEKIEQLRVAGQRRAEAQGVCYQFEHLRKTVLAEIAQEYRTALSRAKQKATETAIAEVAATDPRYRQHLVATAAAIEEKSLAESEYWALRSELEWDEKAIAHLNAMSRLEAPRG